MGLALRLLRGHAVPTLGAIALGAAIYAGLFLALSGLRIIKGLIAARAPKSAGLELDPR